MNQDKVSLISTYEDELIKKRNRSRLGVTLVLCSIPLFDGIFVLFCLTRKGLGNIFDTLHLICLFYVLILIATTFTGYYGVYRRNYLALRTSMSLFTVQNILIFFITSILLCLFLTYKNFLTDHHAPQFLSYFEVHRSLGVFLFCMNILLRVINLFLTWYCGELESAFEVLHRSKYFKDKHKEIEDNDQFQIDIKDDFEHIY